MTLPELLLAVGFQAEAAVVYAIGRWNGSRALDRVYDTAYRDGYNDAQDARDEWDRGRDLWPDEPDPRPGDPMSVMLALPEVYDALAADSKPSPYAGELTPAQRRRDKHKQRGEYAPDWRDQMAADLAPPDDVPRPGAATRHDGGQMAGSSPRGQEYPAAPGHPTWHEVGPPLLAAPSAWLAARIERWEHELASIGEPDWLSRAFDLTAVA